MLRSVYGVPLRERNSFTLPQKYQPGWENNTILLGMLRSPSLLFSEPPRPLKPLVRVRSSGLTAKVHHGKFFDRELTVHPSV